MPCGIGRFGRGGLLAMASNSKQAPSRMSAETVNKRFRGRRVVTRGTAEPTSAATRIPAR